MPGNTRKEQSNGVEKSSGRSPGNSFQFLILITPRWWLILTFVFTPVLSTAVLIDKPNHRLMQGTYCVLSLENDVLGHRRAVETSPPPLSVDAGAEVGVHHHGEKTTWVRYFAQGLADLHKYCVKEENGEDVLLPNPFFQDNWVRGWERVPCPVDKQVINKLGRRWWDCNTKSLNMLFINIILILPMMVQISVASIYVLILQRDMLFIISLIILGYGWACCFHKDC